MRSGDADGDPMLCVLGEPIVDMLPVPTAGAASTAPQFVARPGGDALDVAVAADRLRTPVRPLARWGTGPLGANLRRHAELSGIDGSGCVTDPPSRAELDAARAAR